jgi:hypothetical protein
MPISLRSSFGLESDRDVRGAVLRPRPGSNCVRPQLPGVVAALRPPANRCDPSGINVDDVAVIGGHQRVQTIAPVVSSRTAGCHSAFSWVPAFLPS